MLDKTSQENASQTVEDEALDAERDNLKYRIKCLTEDLDYVARDPRTASKEQDKRRFERELLELRHEKLPELERKLKARDERRKRRGIGEEIVILPTRGVASTMTIEMTGIHRE